MRTIDQDDPPMRLAYPLFSFPSDAANDAIAAMYEHDAQEEQRAFTKAYRAAKAKGGEPSPGYLRWQCAPTLVRPRLASVRCSKTAEIGPLGAWITVDGRTLAVDGPTVRVMKPSEFFTRKPVGVEGFTARAADAVNFVIASCGGTKKIDAQHAEAAIAGFTVDERAMTLMVTSDLACSAYGNEVALTWEQMSDLMDAGGAAARVGP